VGLPFTTVQDLYTGLRSISDHSRPAYDQEILGALNFGYKEAIRTIAAVRTELFASFTNSFTLPASAYEIDVSTLDPPMLRPVRLMVRSQSGSNRAIVFRYRALHSQDYEAAEISQSSGTFNTILYDILQGKFPGATTTLTSTGTGTTLNVADATNFPPGTFFSMPVPPRVSMPNTSFTPQPQGTEAYYGLVQARLTNQLTVAPAITGVYTAPTGTVLTQLQRMILRVANPPTQQQTGQLWYQYRPRRLVNLDEFIDPIVAEYQDLILYYALSQYLGGVDDSEAGSWLQKAQLLKSEVMQDLEPLSGQNSEALDSDLWALG